MLNYFPRTGNCSQCGRINVVTNMHHTAYDDTDPLAYTIELCKVCHCKETWKLRQYDTKKYRNRNTVSFAVREKRIRAAMSQM